MPNYIKNRIQLIGSAEDIKSLLDKFSTHFERTPSLACDGAHIYKHSKSCEIGWWDVTNLKFTRRGKPDKSTVPEGFEQEFDEAWSRFPDFNKVVPMPKGLESNPHSGIQIWIEICTGQIDFKSGKDQSSMENVLSGLKTGNAIRALTEDRNVAKFTDEELELFFQGIRNYRQYGYMSWYEWSIANWGTKWNSSDCEQYANNIYDFTTAWSGVPSLIEKMSKECPAVKILYKYSDEDTGHNCGIGEYQNGKISFRRLEGGTKESYELAFELRPDRAENYQLVGDKYEYVDSEA